MFRKLNLIQNTAFANCANYDKIIKYFPANALNRLVIYK